jgi:hypothetical protein
VSAGTSDGNVKSPAIFYKAQVPRPHAPQNDDVSLSALEGIDSRDLDGFQGLILLVNNQLIYQLLLRLVGDDNTDTEIGTIIRLTIVLKWVILLRRILR